MTRIDPTVSFGVSTNWQFWPLGYKAFSVEWSGYITAPSTGTYTFQLGSDDASWLYINGNLVVNDGICQFPPGLGGNYAVGSITLTAGVPAAIDIYQIENGYCGCTGTVGNGGYGDSGVDAYWAAGVQTAGSTSFTIIPTNVLTPAISSGFPDSVSVSDSSSYYQILHRSYSDAVSLADNAHNLIGTVLTKGLIDSFAISDSYSKLIGVILTKGLLDGFGVSDTYSKLIGQTITRGLTDSLHFVDSLSKQILNNILPTPEAPFGSGTMIISTLGALSLYAGYRIRREKRRKRRNENQISKDGTEPTSFSPSDDDAKRI
jgi:hypothetical protein